MYDQDVEAQGVAVQVLARVSDIFANSLGLEPDELEPNMILLEIGADSFTMMTAIRKLRTEFGVAPTIRELFENQNTIGRIAQFIADRSPGIRSVPAEPARPLSHVAAPVRAEPVVADRVAPLSPQSATASPGEPPRRGAGLLQGRPPSGLSEGERADSSTHFVPRAFHDQDEVPPLPADGSDAWVDEAAAGLTPQQSRYLEEFIARYTARTAESKRRAQESRPVLCNSRKTSSGFRRETKDLLYPIVASRSQGAYVWDLDGNKYVDIAMGFGSTLFGHNPPFLKAALAKQLESGIQVGPDSDWAFENAQLIADITGFDRVLFSNTGTEAVMTAVRIARAATGRNKIVVFRNSYHGHNDAVLVVPDPDSDDYASAGMVPGIPKSAVSETYVLPYGSTKPIGFIEDNAHEIAAILVEPVRNYLGNENPGEFLQELRRISERNGIVLIFDEVLVGFRIALGGAQEWFGVRADMATYGKAVAGGVPVGVIAGRKWCMDLVDGGAWSYGDDSAPKKRQTYTAGTFCKHPLAMAATNATMKELLSRGPALQERLNRRTAGLCEILGEVVAYHGVPIQIHRFGSNFRFALAGNLSFAFQPLELDIFFYHVLLRGVYVWEGRTCFLSTEHSDDDINHIVAAVNGAILDMKQAGFWGSGEASLLPLESAAPPPPLGERAGGIAGLADGAARIPHSPPETSSIVPAANGASIVYESLCPIVSPDLVASEATPTAPSQTKDLVLPLTEDQKTLLMLNQISVGAMMTNSQTWALRVQGKLDVELLEQAYQEVTDRHIGMRVTVDEAAETQTFHCNFPVQSDFIDYSTHGRVEAELNAKSFLQREAERQYDLLKSLHRLTVLKLDDELWLVVLSCNHITIDGVSVSIVYTELAAIYNARLQGTKLELAEPLGFDEFVRWRERQAAEPAYFEQENFWLSRIGCELPVLDLPTDHPRPPVNSFAGSSCRLGLGDDFFTRLKAFSRERRYTYFMVVYAAFQVLLYRLTGQREMVVGVPFNGRTIPGSDLMVGFCSNIYPIVHDVDPAEPISSFLDRVRDELFLAYENQDYPFSSLLRKGLTTRDPSRFPFFSVSFNWDRLTLPRLQGADVSWEEFRQEHVKFDLVPNLMEVNDELTVMLEYNTSLFSHETARRFCDYYEQILQQMVAHPDQTIAALGGVSAADRENQLERWSGGTTPRVDGLCLHHLFEQQTAVTPDGVALGTEQGDITYGEVNRRANQLARRLLKAGAEHGGIVGLCLHRSVEQVVAMLACMKIGVAYLPLDPEYPPDRLTYFVADSGVRLVVATSDTREPLRVSAADILCLDDTKTVRALSRLGVGNLDCPVVPEDRVYVIYTSGSTGNPKGVEVNHVGVVNLAHNWERLWREQGIDKSQRFGWNSSFSFDGSLNALTQCFMGRPLVLLQGMANRSPRDLWRYLDALDVGIWDMTPSQLQLVLPALADSGVTRVPHLVVGGEAISQTLWNDIQASCRDYGLTAFNIYGPTECSVISNVALLSDYERSNIGPVLNNVKAYVLDDDRRLIPTGAKGELYLGGIGVARGYLNKPELTADRFVEDPFSDQPGARMYATGDIVRWLQDGTIEYVGRHDAQVKVRGYRVELGEVESALLKLDCVRQAGVIHRQGEDGASLAAYVVLAEESSDLTVEQVRQKLKARLPEFMVPSLWSLVAELPLSPNGKLDRKALHAMPIVMNRTITEPRTATESTICAIWREVLGIEGIGIFDDFFVVGGHSLLAIRCISRIKERLGASLTLPDFFGAPTVALLAERIETAVPRPKTPVITSARHLPLSPAQHGLWFLSRLEGAGVAYNISHAYRLDGPLDTAALDWALACVIARHESLRTVYEEKGGQVFLRPVSAATGGLLTEIQIPEGAEEAGFVWQQMEEAARIPFDLTADLMVRARLVGLGGDRRLLQLTFHHIAVDGWSIGVFLSELQAFYANRVGLSGETPPPPELQFGDYARWQRELLQGEGLDRLTSYWRERLRGAPSAHELPVDYPRPAKQSFRGDAIRRSVQPQLYACLKELARSQGTTAFILLQTAFAAHLARWQRTNDVVMGTPTSGRNQPETHPLIGNFVNTLALRTQVDPAKPFRTLLAENRRRILADFEHQDLPFEMVVEELNPPRSTSHAPVFQIMFALDSGDGNPPDLAGLEVRQRDHAWERSKFDLTLHAAEVGDDLVLEWEYSTDLFEEATVSSLAESFEVLLEHVVEAPDTLVGALRLTKEADPAALVGACASEEAPAFCVHRRFEFWAASAPLAPAVVFEGETLDYGTLNARANRLARVLVERGVQRDALVGLCLERSPEMIVAVLAVLKAGGAYVPLDPAYPEARLQHMLEDSAVGLVLTDRVAAARLPASSAVTLVLDDPDFAADCNRREAEDIPPEEVDVDPESLAYVIYTSGSTGKPKGVMIEHRNLANLVVAEANMLRVEPGKRVLQFSSFSFDASVFEWSLALCTGAELAMIGEDARTAGEVVSNFVEAQRITHALLPPVLLPQLTPDRFAGLDALIVGGETWSGELARRFSGVCDLYNAYGPTESTVIATMGKVADGAVRLTIGRPLANVRCRIVDGVGGVVPTGMVGELHVGGAGVGRGYHGQPELTDRTFLPDPLGHRSQVYRTGDLVRIRASGELEFVGREDSQVKVRGFRIELSEIEEVALSHSGVAEAVASAQRATSGETMIVLYFVRRSGAAVSPEDLRVFLASHLPSAMVPARLVALDAIPRTTSNKVDHAALRALTPETDLEQPETECERTLIDLWRRVLNTDRIGAGDDFFACGGHSLTATVLIAEVQAAFGIRLRLEDVFSSSVLRDMARLIVHLAEGSRLLAACTEGAGEVDEEQVMVVV
jgi:amino acid adenylation domain-containing protein